MEAPNININAWKYLVAVLDHLAETEDDVINKGKDGWDFHFEYEYGNMYHEGELEAHCAGFTGVSYSEDKGEAENDWLSQVHLYYTDHKNVLEGWEINER